MERLNKLCTIFNRLFVLWVILGGVSAYFYPHVFLPMKSLMELFFAITMFGVGMVLNPNDFIDIFKKIKVVIIGVSSQFSIMAFSAYFISKTLGLSDEFALGLILAGSAPGAMASNVLSYLAGADVAYSVSLTTVSTLLAPVLTPLLTLLLASTFFEIPFWAMFLSVVKMVLVPLLLGILVKRFFTKQVTPIIPVFPAISTFFIALINSVVIALNRDFLPQIQLVTLFAVIFLNLFGLFAGYMVGVISRFDILRRRALSIEIGMQNAGLGMVLALTHFNERSALPSVMFAFFCIFTASILVPIWARSNDQMRGVKK